MRNVIEMVYFAHQGDRPTAQPDTSEPMLDPKLTLLILRSEAIASLVCSLLLYRIQQAAQVRNRDGFRIPDVHLN